MTANMNVSRSLRAKTVSELHRERSYMWERTWLELLMTGLAAVAATAVLIASVGVPSTWPSVLE